MDSFALDDNVPSDQARKLSNLKLALDIEIIFDNIIIYRIKYFLVDY